MLPLNTATVKPTSGVTLEEIPSPQLNTIVQPVLNQAVDPIRAKNTLERTLNLVSCKGQHLGTIQLPVFLKNLFQCMKVAKIEPKHFDVSGGGVAYLIGPENAKSYADQQGILNPQLAEFDRLKDLDLSIDLSGHSDYCLWVMKYFVLKALQQSGIKQNETQLNSVFLRRKIIDGMCILSIGDPNGFWVDFSFIVKGRRELFVRDNPRCDLIPYFATNQYALNWRSPSANPMQPICNRLQKILDINDPETINHLGFPLSQYYKARGYEISNPNDIKIMAKQYVKYHFDNQKDYGETFQAIRQNHIGDDSAIYEKMVAACLRELLTMEDSHNTGWLENLELTSDSRECRFLNFIKTKGMERYHLSATDVNCLAEIIGVRPKMTCSDDAWISFFQKRIDFDTKDRQSLFSCTDSLAMFAAKKLLQNKGFKCPIPTLAVFDLLQPSAKDKDAFIEMKFEWEVKHAPQKALETLIRHRHMLPEGNKIALCAKALSLDCQVVQPYLPVLFADAIEKTKWLAKLIQEGFSDDAIQLCLSCNTQEIYTFALEQFIKTNQIHKFVDCLNQVKEHNPTLYPALMANKKWEETFSKHIVDEKDFIFKLNQLLSGSQNSVVLNLLKMNTKKFTIPADMLEKIFMECYRPAFQANDFETLDFLLKQYKNWVNNNELIIDLISQVDDKSADIHKKEWGIRFFASPLIDTHFPALIEKLVGIAKNCTSQIKIGQAEIWLKRALEVFSKTKSSASFTLVHHCMMMLQAHHKTIAEDLMPLLSQAAINLLQEKDSVNLLLLFKAIRSLRLKLDLPRESLLQIHSMKESADQLLKLLSQVCQLPVEEERSIFEMELQKLALTKPKKAKALFGEKSTLWIYSPKALSSLFESLPIDAPLRYEVFLRFQQWDKDTWKQMVQLKDASADQVFHLLMDPRARGFVDKQWMTYFLAAKKGSLAKASKLMEKYPGAMSIDVLLDLLKSECTDAERTAFLKLLPSLESEAMASKAVVDEIKIVLKKLHDKSSYALVEYLIPIKEFIGKLPQTEQKAFAVYFLDLLPIDFEEDIFSEEERLLLHGLVEVHAVKSPFSVYLNLTEPASDKVERAFKELIELKPFKNDRNAQRKILPVFSKMISEKPALWKPLGVQFHEEYLSNKGLCLSSGDIVAALTDATFPELQHLFLQHAVKSNATDYARQVLNQLEALITQNKIGFCKDIVAQTKFASWTRQGYLATDFKKAVEKLVIKCIQNAGAEAEDVKIRTLRWVIKHIQLCNFKDVHFDQVWKPMAGCLAQGVFKAGDEQPYLTVANEFVDVFSQLLGFQKPDVRQQPLPKGTITPELAGKIPANASKFQLAIVQALQDGWKAPASKIQQALVVSSSVQLFNSIIPALRPEASKEFCTGMQTFISNFFTSNVYQDNFQSFLVFQCLTMAVALNVFKGNFPMLLETANIFSGLNVNNKRRLDLLGEVFNSITIDDQFIKFWNKEYTYVTNKDVIHSYRLFLMNMVYSVPPTDPDFPGWCKDLLTLHANLVYWKYIEPSIYEILSWSMYAKLYQGTMDENMFCNAFDLIIENFPKQYISTSFSYLVEVFELYFLHHSIPVTEPVIKCLSKLWAMKPVANASSHEMQLYYRFASLILDHCGSRKFPAALRTVLMANLFKWPLPDSNSSYDILKTKESLSLIKYLANSHIAKGSSVIIIESLQRMTEFIFSKCNNIKQNQEAQHLLLAIFEMAIHPEKLPDPESQGQWGPIVFKICEKIITGIDPEFYYHLGKLLSKDQALKILPADKINQLKNMIGG